MLAAKAFEERESTLAKKLGEASDIREAATAVTMELEQIACVLAQDETDELARQRQRAVLAVVRHAPQLLLAARAEGRLLQPEEEAEKKPGFAEIAQKVCGLGGALLLTAVAVAEMIENRPNLAAVQLFAVLLLAVFVFGKKPEAPKMRAEGVVTFDVKAVLREIRQLCQAADTCAGDLAMLSRDETPLCVSGTADEATVDLLCALMEARESGNGNMALRSLERAEQYLHMLGLTPVRFDPQDEQTAALFDVLPTLHGHRTIRPAILRDGQVVRRGVAAMEQRSVSL